MLLPAELTAQASPGRMPAGSEMERYLRILQLVGKVPTGPWSARPFGPRELRGLRPIGEHPWRQQIGKDSAHGRLALAPTSFSLIGNSAFPYGFNDGPV